MQDQILGTPVAMLVPVVAATLAATGYVATQVIDEVRARLVTLLST